MAKPMRFLAKAIGGKTGGDGLGQWSCSYVLVMIWFIPLLFRPRGRFGFGLQGVTSSCIAEEFREVDGV